MKIAAECRGDQVRGFDGARAVSFGGTLPDLYDAGDKTFVSFEVDGMKVSGYDRHSSDSYSAHITDSLVRVYDYGQSAWFSYDVQNPKTAKSYHREPKGTS